jgi:hypothetical protein
VCVCNVCRRVCLCGYDASFCSKEEYLRFTGERGREIGGSLASGEIRALGVGTRGAQRENGRVLEQQTSKYTNMGVCEQKTSKSQ